MDRQMIVDRRGRGNGWLLCLATFSGIALAIPAGAQVAQTENEDLSEVVVTARRVEERAQDVPISMTIFSQQALSDRNIVTSSDLAAATPSVAVDNGFGNDVTSFAIRGFVQQANTTPSVAVYFADAVVPRGGAAGEPAGSGVAPGSFFDLQNVQVLKGPQGTLFGRNTDGGAVLLVPKKPTSEFEGYIEGSYGNFAMGQVEGVLNVPLSDSVRVRLGINHETRNGFENNISGIGPQNFDNLNYTAVRASVVADITPDLENYTVATYNLSVNNGLLPQLFACNDNEAAQAAFNLCEPLLRQVRAGGTYAVVNDLTGAESYLKQYQVINTTTWHMLDNLTVKNVANWGLLVTKLDSSLFGAFLNGGPAFTTPFISSTSNPSAAGAQTTDQYTWSDELQFSGSLFDDKLTWQGGGYIERSGPKGDLTGTRSAAFLGCVNGLPFQCDGFGLTNLQTSTAHYNDQAVFGQATYAILRELKITGGIRYTNDNTTATVHSTIFSGYPFGTPGTFSAESCSNAGTVATGCTGNVVQNSRAPTYLLGLDYSPLQDVLLYAKYSRGYRQGSAAPFSPPAYQIFAPEYVNSFELGEKTSFSGPVTGTFDVTGHYNAFSDQQLLAGFILPTGPAAGVLNAGKSRIWGIEVESTLSPIKPVTLGVSYSYLNTKLQSAFVPVGALPPGVIAQFPTFQGNVLPFSPRNKVSANATYRLPIPEDVGNVSLSANYTYTSALLVSVTAAPYDTLGAYGILGMNLHWDNILRSPIDAELFATNLTNRVYDLNLTQLYSTSFGIASRYPGEPRMYGVRVKIRLGK